MPWRALVHAAQAPHARTPRPPLPVRVGESCPGCRSVRRARAAREAALYFLRSVLPPAEMPYLYGSPYYSSYAYPYSYGAYSYPYSYGYGYGGYGGYGYGGYRGYW